MLVDAGIAQKKGAFCSRLCSDCRIRCAVTVAFGHRLSVPSMPALEVLEDPNQKVLFALGSFASAHEDIVALETAGGRLYSGSFNDGVLGEYVQELIAQQGVTGKVHTVVVDVCDQVFHHFFHFSL